MTLTPEEKQVIERFRELDKNHGIVHWTNTSAGELIEAFLIKERRAVEYEVRENERKMRLYGTDKRVYPENFMGIKDLKEKLRKEVIKENKYDLRYCPHCHRMVNSVKGEEKL